MDPNGLILEFTLDHPDVEKIARRGARMLTRSSSAGWLGTTPPTTPTARERLAPCGHADSSDRILTTHVGSLPRSQAVTDVLFARERSDARDRAPGCADSSRKRCARSCAARWRLGIDVVSDGEMSKISYATYVARRFSGFAGDTPREPGQDLVEFPGPAAQAGRARIDRQVPPAALRRGPSPSRIRRRWRPTSRTSRPHYRRRRAAAAFMNAASPGVIALFQPNDYYRTQDEYLEALAEALQQRVRGDRRAPGSFCRSMRPIWRWAGTPCIATARWRSSSPCRPAHRGAEPCAAQRACRAGAHARVLGQLRRTAPP